jgi:hypothetical protein
MGRWSRLTGSLSTVAASLLVAYAIMFVIHKAGTLRLHAAGEIAGLDLTEHGAAAYPEYIVVGNDGTPRSLEEANNRGYVPGPVAVSGD